MAAAKKLLEFRAQRPWGPEEGVEDLDEDDEDDNDEAEDGFSLEEVLRLGGTKVKALGSWRRGTKARGMVRSVACGRANGPAASERCGVGGRTEAKPRLRNMHCTLLALLFHPFCKRKVVSN